MLRMVHSVLVVGATGATGPFIAEQIAKAGHKTAALVRKTDSTPGKIDRLKAAGVGIVDGSTALDIEALAAILKDYDTIVSAISGPDLLSGQLRLVEAAKKAGTIKRFFPSEYSGKMDLNGPNAHRMLPLVRARSGQKLEVLEAIKAAGIDYTAVITHCFFGWLLSNAGNISFPPAPPPPKKVDIYAGGNTAIATIDEVDVGRVVAAALDDPRTANKRVVVKINLITQNEMVEGYRKVGVNISTNPVSEEELDARIQAAEGFAAVPLGLAKELFLPDGPYTWQGPMTGDAVSATELYLDLKFNTPENYFKTVAAGRKV